MRSRLQLSTPSPVFGIRFQRLHSLKRPFLALLDALHEGGRGTVSW